MTVVGMSWMLVALSTMSIIIAVDAVVAPPLSLSSPSIAFSPVGVQAFPRPRMFVDRFSAKYLFVSASVLPNSQSMTGSSSEAILFDSPVASTSEIIPSHTA